MRRLAFLLSLLVLSFPLLAVSLVLLAVVPFIGAAQGDARRWIDLGFTTFQPSEIAKLAVILYFAALICKYKSDMATFRYGRLAPLRRVLRREIYSVRHPAVEIYVDVDAISML